MHGIAGNPADSLAALRAVRRARAERAVDALLHSQAALEAYRWVRLRGQPAAVLELCVESHHRLSQCAWLVHRVDALQDVAGYSQGFELEILIEAFYFAAWRAREAIRSVPGLSAFDAQGVRNVRNHLIEHPEKHGGLFVGSLAFGAEEGPRLKVVRYKEHADVHEDAGLYANAEEFADRFYRTLMAPSVPIPPVPPGYKRRLQPLTRQQLEEVKERFHRAVGLPPPRRREHEQPSALPVEDDSV